MGMISGGSLLSTLGTLSRYASAAMPVVQAISTIKGVADNFGGGDASARAQLQAQQDLALQQLRAQQGLSESNDAAQAALDKQNIALNAQNAETTRRAALRRAVSRQRAAFGSQGLTADDGSGEAVLLGLFDESDSERRTRERLDTLRTQAIDQNLDGTRRINVLQRTQLQERQNLDRALAGY